MAMVYATGHLSGAHLNPAVTAAFALTRHFPRAEAVAYLRAQLAGALVAAALPRRRLARLSPPTWATTVPTVGVGSAFVYEVVLTAFLMFVIMAVATDTRAVGAAAAIAIGGTVGLDALFGGPVTGASMNPARSLGPALVSGETARPLDLPPGPAARRRHRRPRLPARPRRAPRDARRRGGLMARALFVCLHNAGRSQMSEALFRRAAEGGTRRARQGRRRPSASTPRWSRRWPSWASTSATAGRTGSRARTPSGPTWW